ncbi:MAG: cytochrome c3 family protein [Thermodesulfovibrionales bacterium]
MQRILIIVTISVLLASCSLNRFLGLERPEPAPNIYMNPHQVCSSCHEENDLKSGRTDFASVDFSSACPGCHDYKENHHPVDFRPADLSAFPFPLRNGKVTCLTCHEIHGGESNEGTFRLLRGGPYSDRRTICFKCHSRDQYSAVDPHKMLDEQGKIRMINGSSVCLICHAREPNPAVDWTSDVRFKADVGFLCWRCHPPMPGIFFTQHFLVKPTASTLQIMNEAEERLLLVLPIVPRGRITCSTCHNPHQEGVILHDGAAKGADATSKLRSPSLCFACHRM